MSANPINRIVRHATIAAAILFAVTIAGFGQIRGKQPPPATDSYKATPAYAEVILRKTELSAELEVLLVEYTDEFPKVKDLRFEIGLLQKEIDRLAAVPAADQTRLTSALGRLMIHKCDAAATAAGLEKTLSDEHPDLKRAKRRIEIFEAAVKEILAAK